MNALLSAVYELIGRRNLDEAIGRIESALGLHFDNQELTAVLKCAKYWQDRFLSMEKYPSGYEKAEYLLAQWKGFPAFVSRFGGAPERCVNAFKTLVFREALAIYESLVDASVTGTKDGDILMRIGRCYKSLGEYDKALQNLDAANQIKKENAEILAELADCYALVGEIQISKAFFREAFFINPEAVDLDGIESVMICRLVDKLREMGMEGPQLAQWLPVYGVLFNVLNIKRELRPIEYGKLRQSIYTMEMEMRESPAKKEASLARLVNRYFWLIDHYRMTKESREKIDEVLLKIRELSPTLYDEYTK
ncbi:MAG: tetratricopeptide repeat protein [Spirochaetales bacterium]|nr:tetratricopeptide repeat protein [Spirochaetales bacterium]